MLGFRLILPALVALALGAGEAQAAQPHPFAGERTVTVMTRNLYLGTELQPIFGARSLPELFAAAAAGYVSVEASDPAARAAAVAGEIQAAEPDLVALQEAALYRVDSPPDGPATPAETVTYDFLALLESALAARGLSYEPVGLFTGVDHELPAGLPPTTDVRLTDRHVVLVRSDAKTADLKVEGVQVGRYEATLTVPTLAGPVEVPRGWSAIDVMVRGKRFRLVHTHLEAFSPLVQARQTEELLVGPAATGRPVVLLGDLNSEADGTRRPAYPMLLGAGFSDTWTGGGRWTCCHDVFDPAPSLEERIDYVLTRGGFEVVATDVVGDDPGDRTASGLWPSDHAGVVATLRLPDEGA